MYQLVFIFKNPTGVTDEQLTQKGEHATPEYERIRNQLHQLVPSMTLRFGMSEDFIRAIWEDPSQNRLRILSMRCQAFARRKYWKILRLDVTESGQENAS